MAQVLSSYNFGQSGGRPEKYPWDTWFDGRIRRLNRGQDFTNHPVHFRGTVYQAAQRPSL